MPPNGPDLFGDGFTKYGRIVPDDQTDEEALAEAWSWAQQQGMEFHPEGEPVIVSREVPVARGITRVRRTVRSIARPMR